MRKNVVRILEKAEGAERREAQIHWVRVFDPKSRMMGFANGAAHPTELR